MSKIIYKLSTTKFVLIEQSVINTILTKKQSHPLQPESGGVLIGEYRGEHLYIFDLTLPGIPDIQKRTYFDRCSPHHNNYVQECWKKSGNTQVWLGEWHTHPENMPTPSSFDNSMWKKNLPNRDMILIIQGITNIWFGHWNGRIISKIHI